MDIHDFVYDVDPDCTHENKDYDPGNHVPPYGWEIYPGWYCTDCGEMLDIRDKPDMTPPGPSREELTEEQDNPL